MTTNNSEPLAVLISDIHFNINNITLAATALKMAISEADKLNVPLVIAGDLHDTKAIIRAEVANVLIQTFQYTGVPTYIMVGNHDLINEKHHEHGLNYLRPYVIGVVDSIAAHRGMLFIPYQSSPEKLKAVLSDIPQGSIIIMHQGFLGANMGDYAQDKTSISPDLVKNYKVFSGHYHRHQTIGTVTYIGSPFTHTFGEANDGPKGFLVINKDGTFTRKCINLPRHIIKNIEVNDNGVIILDKDTSRPDDKVLIKLHGSRSNLQSFNRSELEAYLGKNYRIELFPTEEHKIEINQNPLNNYELMDNIINTTEETEEQKKYLKELWRETFERDSQ